jgi:formate dehydrogenase major subunit
VPIDGKTETLNIDTVILATGQAVEPEGLTGLNLTRKRAIVYDKFTHATSLGGVFAGGDCGNDKISIAIESIAAARKTALSVDAYLHGAPVALAAQYVHEREDISEKTFEDRERMCRAEYKSLSPEQRRDNFLQVYESFTHDDAAREASRCLECGCSDYFECKLLKNARSYGVAPECFCGGKTLTELDDAHPYVKRDPNKCILCGLCVRVCAQLVGAEALGLTARGFDVVVRPAMGKPLEETSCVSCGMCVSVCPTGALREKTPLAKPVPLEETVTETTCVGCSVGCSTKITTHGNIPLRILPRNGGVNRSSLCRNGRFALVDYPEPKALDERAYRDAILLMGKALQRAQAVYGASSAAIALSAYHTNEEIAAAQRFTARLGVRLISPGSTPSPLLTSPNTFSQL